MAQTQCNPLSTDIANAPLSWQVGVSDMQVRVTAVNSVNSAAPSPVSVSSLFRLRPGAPTSVNAAYGSNGFTITWSPGNAQGNSDISYIVYYRSQGSAGAWSEVTSSTASVRVDAGSLTSGTNYEFKVVARSAFIGDSADSVVNQNNLWY